MIKSVLATGIAGLLLLSGPGKSTVAFGETVPDLELAINGTVSANGLFPSQAMEEEFAAYLRWTKMQGLSRLVAFESMIGGGSSAEIPLPDRRMEEQFGAYMRWVDEQGLSPFSAFMATDFD